MSDAQRIVAKLVMMVRRGRVVKTILNAKRALVQISGLADETKNGVELFFPYGFSAKPPGGADVILLQVGGSAAHLIALLGDDPALRIADLGDGEFGWKDRNGQQIVFRTDRIEIITPAGKKLLMTVGGDLEQTVTGDVTVTAQGNASVTAQGNVTVDGAAVLLGDGSKKVALDQDPVVDGKVQASSTKVKAS